MQSNIRKNDRAAQGSRNRAERWPGHKGNHLLDFARLLGSKSHDWLKRQLPFEDVVGDSNDTFDVYFEKMFMLLIYRLSLVCIALCYTLSETRPSLPGRVWSACIALYIIIKLAWILPNWTTCTLRRWALGEIGVIYIVSNLLNLGSAAKGVTANLLIYSSTCIFANSFILNLVLGCLVTAHCSYIVASAGGNCQEYVPLILCACMYIAALSKMCALVIAEYSRRLAQAQQKAKDDAESKSMFVASISHDLKNPLNSILGTIDGLKKSVHLLPAEKEQLLTASYSCQIMLYLIGNILDVTKMGLGKFDVDCIPMSLSSEVLKIVQIETELARPKGLRLYKSCLTPLPSLVYGDPMRFTQVLINIVGNSIKFTSAGYIAIVLRWARHVADADRCGAGLPDWSGSFNAADFIPDEKVFTGENERTDSGNGPQEHPRLLLSPLLTSQENNLSEWSPGAVHARMTRYLPRPSKRMAQSPALVARPLRQSAADGPPTNFSAQVQSKWPERCHSITPEKTPPTHISPPVGRQTTKCLAPTPSDSSEAHEDAALHNPHRDRRDHGDSGILVIDVIDTGVGMTKEETQRLFQPFSQANAGIKRTYGGTGLGLWITRELVRLMCGSMELRSEAGVGTRFQLKLPLKVCEREERQSNQLNQAKDSNKAGDIERNRLDLPVAPTADSPGDKKSEGLEAEMLRSSGTRIYSGPNKQLRGMRLLLLEDEKCLETSKLSQIVQELSQTDAALFYSTYRSAMSTLDIQGYNFKAIVVIATNDVVHTQRTVAKIMKQLEDNDIRHIPFAIASGTSDTLP
jgi:signal transduction histidine kinase